MSVGYPDNRTDIYGSQRIHSTDLFNIYNKKINNMINNVPCANVHVPSLSSLSCTTEWSGPTTLLTSLLQQTQLIEAWWRSAKTRYSTEKSFNKNGIVTLIKWWLKSSRFFKKLFVISSNRGLIIRNVCPSLLVYHNQWGEWCRENRKCSFDCPTSHFLGKGAVK